MILQLVLQIALQQHLIHLNQLQHLITHLDQLQQRLVLQGVRHVQREVPSMNMGILMGITIGFRVITPILRLFGIVKGLAFNLGEPTLTKVLLEIILTIKVITIFNIMMVPIKDTQ